jgi:hypothetical protein
MILLTYSALLFMNGLVSTLQSTVQSIMHVDVDVEVEVEVVSKVQHYKLLTLVACLITE